MALVFFLFVDLGGTLTGTAHPVSLIAAALWAGPLWIYARMVGTRAVALAGGAGLLAVTAGFLVVLFRNTHSTAGIGVATIPMLLYPLAVGLVAIDRLIWGRPTGDPVLRGLGRRLLAVPLSIVVVYAVISTVTGIVLFFDPVTRGDLVARLLSTLVYALAALGGILTIVRLWRPRSPSMRDPSVG